MKKLSNRILVAILVLLAALYVVSRFFHAPGLESNLRKDLVKVDTSKITEVRISPSGHTDGEITLIKTGNSWKVKLGTQEAQTDVGVVKSALGMLLKVQPQRKVSRKKEKWEEFNVGEKGTHVSVYQNSSMTADFVVGKTGFTPASNGGFAGGYTYFRLSQEDDVYAVEGFFESGFNRAFNDWRDKSFVRLKKEEVNRISFTYPSDTGFVAEKKDSIWYVANAQTEPGAMENYLSQLSNKNLNDFAKAFIPSREADIAVDINENAGKVTRIQGWKQEEKWILVSTLQKDVYFSSPPDGIKTLLIGRRILLPTGKKK